MATREAAIADSVTASSGTRIGNPAAIAASPKCRHWIGSGQHGQVRRGDQFIEVVKGAGDRHRPPHALRL